MKTLKNILLITLLFLLFTECKRKCQDENADNYKEGKRKATCDYSFADNWGEKIIVDSVVINGVKVELEDESWVYQGANRDEDYVYSEGAQNQYFSEFDDSEFLGDTLETIAYYFGIPIATDYDIEKIEGNRIALYYVDSVNNLNTNNGNEMAFNFIENRNVDGIDYQFYKVEIDDFTNVEIIFSEGKFFDTYIYLSVVYDVYSVSYSMDIDRII